ncbi:hypothetical protein B0H14DRAFT_3534437, partial [Mycena olivaceomarginata]
PPTFYVNSFPLPPAYSFPFSTPIFIPSSLGRPSSFRNIFRRTHDSNPALGPLQLPPRLQLPPQRPLLLQPPPPLLQLPPQPPPAAPAAAPAAPAAPAAASCPQPPPSLQPPLQLIRRTFLCPRTHTSSSPALSDESELTQYMFRIGGANDPDRRPPHPRLPGRSLSSTEVIQAPQEGPHEKTLWSSLKSFNDLGTRNDIEDKYLEFRNSIDNLAKARLVKDQTLTKQNPKKLQELYTELGKSYPWFARTYGWPARPYLLETPAQPDETYRREEKPGGAQGGKENFRPFDPPVAPYFHGTRTLAKPQTSSLLLPAFLELRTTSTTTIFKLTSTISKSCCDTATKETPFRVFAKRGQNIPCQLVIHRRQCLEPFLSPGPFPTTQLIPNGGVVKLFGDYAGTDAPMVDYIFDSPTFRRCLAAFQHKDRIVPPKHTAVLSDNPESAGQDPPSIDPQPHTVDLVDLSKDQTRTNHVAPELRTLDLDVDQASPNPSRPIPIDSWEGPCLLFPTQEFSSSSSGRRCSKPQQQQWTQMQQPQQQWTQMHAAAAAAVDAHVQWAAAVDACVTAAAKQLVAAGAGARTAWTGSALSMGGNQQFVSSGEWGPSATANDGQQQQPQQAAEFGSPQAWGPSALRTMDHQAWGFGSLQSPARGRFPVCLAWISKICRLSPQPQTEGSKTTEIRDEEILELRRSTGKGNMKEVRYQKERVEYAQTILKEAQRTNRESGATIINLQRELEETKRAMNGLVETNVLAESHVVDLATAKADYEKSLRDEKAKHAKELEDLRAQQAADYDKKLEREKGQNESRVAAVVARGGRPGSAQPGRSPRTASSSQYAPYSSTEAKAARDRELLQQAKRDMANDAHVLLVPREPPSDPDSSERRRNPGRG